MLQPHISLTAAVSLSSNNTASIKQQHSNQAATRPQQGSNEEGAMDVYDDDLELFKSASASPADIQEHCRT